MHQDKFGPIVMEREVTVPPILHEKDKEILDHAWDLGLKVSCDFVFTLFSIDSSASRKLWRRYSKYTMSTLIMVGELSTPW